MHLHRIITILLLFVPIYSNAQVTIAPTNVFITENSRFGTFMVVNGSNETQEVSIETYFGYFTNNEAGDKIFVSNDEEMAAQHSVADYVRVFPRNFTIAPNQRQVIRIRVTSPNDLEDGTYWARIRTSTTPETPPIEIQRSDDAIGARVGIKIEQVTGLFYKVGNTDTGIDIQDISTELDDDGNLFVKTSFNKTGNSPFLGTITTSLIDGNGATIYSLPSSTSFYFDGIHNQLIDASELPTGTYTIRVQFETNRSDISENDIISMPTVIETATYIHSGS